MTVDKQVKERKVAKILRNVRFLERVSWRDKDAFLGNYEAILAPRHAIQEATHVCVDLAFHLCAWNKLPSPTSYRNAFETLAEHGLLTQELSKKMENWASLRNLITHVYEKIDDEVLFEIVKNDLGDFEQFLKAIEHLIETR